MGKKKNKGNLKKVKNKKSEERTFAKTTTKPDAVRPLDIGCVEVKVSSGARVLGGKKVKISVRC